VRRPRRPATLRVRTRVRAKAKRWSRAAPLPHPTVRPDAAPGCRRSPAVPLAHRAHPIHAMCNGSAPEFDSLILCLVGLCLVGDAGDTGDRRGLCPYRPRSKQQPDEGLRPLPRTTRRSVPYPRGRAGSGGCGTGTSATHRNTCIESQASRYALVAPRSPACDSSAQASRRSSEASARSSPVARFSSTRGAISMEPRVTGATMRPNPNGRQSQARQQPEKAVRTRIRLACPRVFTWLCISRPLPYCIRASSYHAIGCRLSRTALRESLDDEVNGRSDKCN
jgi:hypothetical protein